MGTRSGRIDIGKPEELTIPRRNTRLGKYYYACSDCAVLCQRFVTSSSAGESRCIVDTDTFWRVCQTDRLVTRSHTHKIIRDYMIDGREDAARVRGNCKINGNARQMRGSANLFLGVWEKVLTFDDQRGPQKLSLKRPSRRV